jgi:two-component system cell cycle sensor histidine kinase/response regulator CckA
MAEAAPDAEDGSRPMDPRDLLERLPLVTYVLDVEPGRPPLYISPQIEDVFGFPPDLFATDPDAWVDRVVDADRPGVVAALRELRTTGAMSVAYRARAADGSEHWVRDSATVHDGRAHGYLLDITREKELERELARERATLDAFFRESSIGLGITDADGRYLRINEALAELNEAPVEAHVGKTLSEVAPEIAGIVDPLRKQAGEHERFLVDLPSRDRQLMLSYFPFTVDGERHLGRVVVDLTEQRRAEAAERRYRKLLEQLPLVAYVNEVDGMRRARFVTQRIEDLTGYSAARFVADPELGDRLIHPDDMPRIMEREATARATGEPFEDEYRIVRADGVVRWVLDRMETVYDEAGVPRYEQGFLVDVTDMHETTSLLRAVWDSAFEAMVVVDDEARCVDANPAACTLFGRTRDQLLGREMHEVSERSDLGWSETTIVRPDGVQREVEGAVRANVLPGRHLSVLRDVTERRQLEQELWRAQKLESVGRLAGGVAHDFNNLLTAVRGYAQLLQARTSPGSVEHHHAREIDAAADRAAALTAQLLALGRRQMLHARPLDLNRRLESMRESLGELTGPDTDVVLLLDRALCAVRVDEGLVLQAIRNLVANAAEAMPNGGSLVVRTVVEEIAARDDLVDGRYAVVRVSDEGPGIDPAALDHVFEPFFTTKGPGEGSGLGLASAYGTIRQSGGTITVESRAGEGSTFSIYLPEATGVDDGPAPGGAGETLLVVERDPAVRDVLFELLTDAGYRVLTAPTAFDARQLAERDVTIDLVLADLDDEPGAELAADLERTRPELHAVPLRKPYTPDRLHRAVRAALASPDRVTDITVPG